MFLFWANSQGRRLCSSLYSSLKRSLQTSGFFEKYYLILIEKIIAVMFFKSENVQEIISSHTQECAPETWLTTIKRNTNRRGQTIKKHVQEFSPDVNEALHFMSVRQKIGALHVATPSPLHFTDKFL